MLGLNLPALLFIVLATLHFLVSYEFHDNRHRIYFNVIELLTIVFALFRLALRSRLQRLWWEDAWAAIAMVGATIFAITILIYFRTHNLKTVIVADWISAYAFTNVVWSVRMSLLYSIVRITPPSVCLRKFMRATEVLFVIIWVSLTTLKTWWCMDKINPRLGLPSCPVLYPLTMFEVIADFAGDVTLMTISIRYIWRIRLPRRRRRMILLIFSSSAIMSMSSLLRAVIRVMHEAKLLVLFVQLELISSMIVCNLLVVVTYIYRVCMSSSESESSSEDDDFTTPMSRESMSLTTVDLDSLDSTTTGPLPDADQSL